MKQLTSQPRKPQILIVDDDPLIGKSLSRALRSHAKVVVEISPEVALERVRRGERFALVVSDIMMPGLSGPHFFERVVAIAPELRDSFIFASGGMSDLLRELLASTGRPCLLKPVTKEAVLEQLEAALRRGKAAPRGP